MSNFKSLVALAAVASFAALPSSADTREADRSRPGATRTAATVETVSRTRHAHGHVGVRLGYHRPYYRGHGYGYGWHGYWGWPYYGPAGWPVHVHGDENRPRAGAVETDVRPGRAEIRIDGEPAGQARDYNGSWDLLWLAPGAHELEFSRDGYQTLRIRVDVDAGSYYRIRQRLARGTGIDPRSDSLAGPSQLPREGPRTEQRERGYERREPPRRDPQPRRDEAPRPTLASGFLTIEAEPADAAVYLDGRFLANASELDRLHGALAVAAGEHTVEVVRPGFRSETRRVTVERDGNATVTIRLQRNRGDT